MGFYLKIMTKWAHGFSVAMCLCVCAGGADDGPRVVFMVDLWHPNVAAAERQALDYIFTPGR